MFRPLVLVLVAGAAVYRLGFRGLPFMLAYLAAFCILFVPVYAVLDRFVPWRPKRTAPPWGGLDLSGARDLRVTPQPTGEEEVKDDSKPEAGNSPEAPPPPQA